MSNFETTLDQLEVGKYFTDDSILYKITDKHGMIAETVECNTGKQVKYYLESIVTKCEGLSLYLMLGGRQWD